MSDELDWHPIRPNDRKPIWVLATEREIEEYRSLSAHSCEHPHAEIRDYRTTNGGWQRKPQCTTCGLSRGNPIPRDKTQNVPDWDYELWDRWQSECESKRKSIEDQLIDRTIQLETTGYAFYEDYLRSPEWIAKRDLVIRRDQRMCQACYLNEATQVHHLTYERIFSEPLFDLVAVCRPCHESLHEKKIASIEAARAKGLKTLTRTNAQNFLGPFCSCGTTVRAAEKLGRSWIGIDVTHIAVNLIRPCLNEALPGIAYEPHGVPMDLSRVPAPSAQPRTRSAAFRLARTLKESFPGTSMRNFVGLTDFNSAEILRRFPLAAGNFFLPVPPCAP